MNQATQPVRGRASVLTAVAIAVVAFASLALASLASAAENPVAAGGKTTITLNSGLIKKLKKSKAKVIGTSPATVSGGKTVTLPIEAGKLSTAGAGELELEGGIKFKSGKKSVSVSKFILATSTNSLTAKVGSKTMKFAAASAATATRNGFGTNVAVSSLKITSKAAKELNKKLGLPIKAKKKKNGKKVKGVPAPFAANQVFGSSAAETQPKTIGVLPTGNASLVLSPVAVEKLENVGNPPFTPPADPVSVQLEPIAPTQVTSPSPLTVAFPMAEGGNVAPNGSAGVLKTAGGLHLIQNLEAVTMEPGNVTTLTMGNIWVDLASRTATVEVNIKNPKTAAANQEFGRASIANLNLTGATIKSDPASHTVSVENATATLQETTATVLNSVFIEPLEKANPMFEGQKKFAAGDPLGTFSFSVTTE